MHVVKHNLHLWSTLTRLLRKMVLVLEIRIRQYSSMDVDRWIGVAGRELNKTGRAEVGQVAANGEWGYAPERM